MESIIPLISAATKGPLGVRHLPRLWLKTILSAAGRLPEGYKDIRPGFDYIVLEGLGIDPNAARDFIFQQKPSYLAFEAWICKQPGVDTSEANIARVNETVVNRKKKPESRARMLPELGLPEDSPIQDSIMLNDLDDWKFIHEQLLD